VPFKQYCADYNGSWGTLEGYILMRLRYAVLKFKYKEAQWARRHGEALVDVCASNKEECVSLLSAAFMKLEPDIQQVLELWAHGHSQASIASTLGIDLRKAKARTSAGIIQLRQELIDEIRTEVE
jgi:DNA-directed RNA polymerase specialized sigma24 family protein